MTSLPDVWEGFMVTWCSEICQGLINKAARQTHYFFFFLLHSFCLSLMLTITPSPVCRKGARLCFENLNNQGRIYECTDLAGREKYLYFFHFPFLSLIHLNIIPGTDLLGKFNFHTTTTGCVVYYF